MENPFINPNNNPNIIDQENLSNQGQYLPSQLNQQKDKPQVVNPPTYNVSSENINTQYSNTNLNQDISQNETNISQNNLLPPYMQFYISEQGIPLNDFSGQNGVTNSTVPSEYNINFENYNNVEQLPHLQFTQPDNNTFLIVTKNVIIPPIILSALSLPIFIIPIIVGIPGLFAIYAGGGMLILIATIFCLFMEYKLCFILGTNTITVKRCTMCRSTSLIFKSGELSKVDYIQKTHYFRGKPRYTYYIAFFPKIGEPELIYTVLGSPKFFTFQEIGFFLHVLNKHIQTKMIPK